MAEPSLSSDQGSPFWRFSLQLYRLPQVAEACIKLQEECGADVNLLLFLLWHGAQRRRLSLVEIERLEREIAPWRATTVVPLRAIRRALKAPPTLVEAGTAEAFRTKIKAVELEAERLQQEAMHALARAAPLGESVATVTEAARANIAAYGAMCRVVLPAPAVEILLDAVGKFHSN